MDLKTINAAMVKNYMTSIGGFLSGVPVLIMATFPNLPPRVQHALQTCTGVGVILLGIVSKQWNNHSTQAQVTASTGEVKAMVAVEKAEVPPKG